MDKLSEIDVKKLEKCFLDADAELRSISRVVQVLENENQHLRQIIEILVTSKSSTL